MKTISLPSFNKLGVALLLFCIAGCGKENTPSKPAGGGGIQFWTSSESTKPVPGFDEGAVMFGFYNDGVVLIWSDTDSISGGFPVSFPHAKADGNFEYYRLKKRIGYSCEYDVNTGSGTCKIDGQTYDLQKGLLFIVSGASTESRVKQLSRDMNKLKDSLSPSFDREQLLDFGKADPEITEFFSNAGAE